MLQVFCKIGQDILDIQYSKMYKTYIILIIIILHWIDCWQKLAEQAFSSDNTEITLIMLAYFYSYRSIKEREKLNKSLNRQKYGIFFQQGRNIESCAFTVFPRSGDPFYIVSYYIKWVTTSWTHSKKRNKLNIVMVILSNHIFWPNMM